MNERLAALPDSKSCDQWFKSQQPITSRAPPSSPETSTVSVFIAMKGYRIFRNERMGR